MPSNRTRLPDGTEKESATVTVTATVIVTTLSASTANPTSPLPLITAVPAPSLSTNPSHPEYQTPSPALEACWQTTIILPPLCQLVDLPALRLALVERFTLPRPVAPLSMAPPELPQPLSTRCLDLWYMDQMVLLPTPWVVPVEGRDQLPSSAGRCSSSSRRMGGRWRKKGPAACSSSPLAPA